MSHDDTTKESTYALETDGLVHGVALICANTLTEAAAAATPERFIHLAVRQLVAAGQEPTAERVAAYLHTTCQAFDATVKELTAL
ncbi:hypothetical protein [Herminiimonas sp. CN]|uniref:hypothetical protein n=1 Tax=Herminiimonas sp. CN TaxID=1349818 RepID=UPI0004740F9F|nr:hypothetical protein [Herminiimonas sp. CN]